MKLKHKISLLVIGLFLVLSLMLTLSYAVWVFSVSQESNNVVVSDCFEMTFTEGSSAINLEHSFPMRDGKGVYTKPYEFTLTNVCEHAADVEINLETLNNSEIAGENLRVDVNGHIKTYGDGNSVEPTLNNASSAAKIYDDTIAAGKSKKIYLRLWIKEDASNNDVINKSYNSKITVRSTLRKHYKVALLNSGYLFNKALKTLAGDSNPSTSSFNNSITTISRSTLAPTEDDNYVNVADNTSSNPIYAWYNDGIIYLYSEADKIYLNKNSQSLFSAFSGITSLDLSYFDTSLVEDMSYMLHNMNNLESIDVSNFDTSNTQKMNSLFGFSILYSIGNCPYKMTSITGLENFDTSKVINMDGMFFGSGNLTNLDVSNFNTSKVTNMYDIFSGLAKVTLLDVSNFDTSNVTNMNSMFENMAVLTNLDVSSFNTSKVTNMTEMFSGMKGLNVLDVSNFDTSKVTNMSSMFSGMKGLKSLDLSGFNTSNVTDMSRMFDGDSNLTLLDVSSFDTSKVTDMRSMFRGLSNIKRLDIMNFDTSNVTNMASMFTEMNSINILDVSSFNTSSVRYMEEMFMNCNNLVTIYVGNNWSIQNLSANESGNYLYYGSAEMFRGDTKLVGGAGTTYDTNHVDKVYAHIDGGPSNPGYLTLKSS